LKKSGNALTKARSHYRKRERAGNIIFTLYHKILLRACDLLAEFFLGNYPKRETRHAVEGMVPLLAINRAWGPHCRCCEESLSAGQRLPAAEEKTVRRRIIIITSERSLSSNDAEVLRAAAKDVHHQSYPARRIQGA